MDNSGMSIGEALSLFLSWAKANNIGPLQTVSMLFGLFGLYFMSKFVGRAKNVVGSVHHVYEQALTDLKAELEEAKLEKKAERALRRKLEEELELERSNAQAHLRTIAAMREREAREGRRLPKKRTDS